MENNSKIIEKPPIEMPPSPSADTSHDPQFVFPGFDKFETLHSPPSPPWSCAIPTASCLDLLICILWQTEQFTLEKMETIGLSRNSSAFRFLDAEQRPLLSVIHIPGPRVRKGEGNKNEFAKMEDEIRFFDATGRSVLLLGREEGGGKTLKVSCGDLTLGRAEGFTPSKKLAGNISVKNSKGHKIFQILPSKMEAVEEVAYKILEGVEGKQKEIGSVRRKDGGCEQFLGLKLNPHLNVRNKALILATIVSIYAKYHVVTNWVASEKIETVGLKKLKNRWRAWAVTFVFLFVTILLIGLFFIVL